MSRSTSELVRIITSADPAQRNRSLDAVCRNATLEQLLAECAALDRFRRTSDNLTRRVRSCSSSTPSTAFICRRAGVGQGRAHPFDGYANLLKRRFEEAIDIFLQTQAAAGGLSDGIASALAAAYQPGLPDFGRPGAAQRAFGARQPVDVPHRSPGRPPAARTA